MAVSEVYKQRLKVEKLEAELVLERLKLGKLETIPKFPIKTTFYSHSEKESNYALGEELGLTEEAIETFRYTGYETTFDIEIEEDGKAYATHVNGTALVSRVEI